MKIALVVPGFSAHERDWCIPALLDYVRVLAQQAEVHVYTLRWPEQRRDYAVYGAAVHALGGRPRMGVRAPALWARAVRLMLAEHRRGPFDVVHAFWADEPGLAAALAGRRLRRPVVVSVAGGEFMALRDIGYGLARLPGRLPLFRWVLRQAARVTAGSRCLLDRVRPHLPPSRRDRLAWAPLGVDTDLFAPAAVPAAPGRTILNVGALYPVKDQARLLRVAARVPGARVVLAGDGPLRPALEAQAEALGLRGRVRFLGAVDHAALAQVYAQAAVLVQTSRHEAQGLAVLEAAACGLPVVGTPVGVLPEVGTAAPDDDALADCVSALLDDDAQRRAAGEAARARVLRDYALAPAVERFARLYAALD